MQGNSDIRKVVDIFLRNTLKYVRTVYQLLERIGVTMTDKNLKTKNPLQCGQKNIDGFELGVKKKTSDNQPDEKPGKEEHAKSDDTNINTGENNQKRTVQKDEISKGEEDGRIDDKTDENMKTPEKKQEK